MITTHVLDTSLGKPVADLWVKLLRGTLQLGAGKTDADGRLRTLTVEGFHLPSGQYHLSFATGAYFERTGQPGFFPVVDIAFTVTDGAASYHVPLLLSPYGYSTYRGS